MFRYCDFFLPLPNIPERMEYMLFHTVLYWPSTITKSWFLTVAHPNDCYTYVSDLRREKIGENWHYPNCLYPLTPDKIVASLLPSSLSLFICCCALASWKLRSSHIVAAKVYGHSPRSVLHYLLWWGWLVAAMLGSSGSSGRGRGAAVVAWATLMASMRDAWSWH